MSTWSQQVENELILIIKDWLKQHGRTQADLRSSLGAVSTRMSSILEVLEKDHRKGGMRNVAARLCAVETEWTDSNHSAQDHKQNLSDPFGQLDLLLEEIRDDCLEDA